jgi:3-methyladenine DNA glycosylase AlkD
MVLDVDMWMMSHVFVQILFCKLPFAMEMAAPWREDSNFVKKRCGYAYLYYLSRDKRIEDSYFVPILDHIEKVIQTEENFVKDAMNNALFSIGQRSLAMNKRCLDIARKIGKVEVDYGDNTCQAVDVIKHLDSERMRKKFG